MGRDGAKTLSDIRANATIVYPACDRRGRYAVAGLLKKHGDARLTDLLQTLADWPKTRSISIPRSVQSDL